MLYKDYFIPNSTQCLFFKPLSYKTHYLLAWGPSTVTHVSISTCSRIPLLRPPFLPGYPGHLSLSRRYQSASFKYLISTDTQSSLLRHLQFSSYDF